MIVGFTGTRRGMTGGQAASVRRELYYGNRRYGPLTFVHGDCIGADAHAHRIALDLGLCVEIRPGQFTDLRAMCQGAEVVHDVETALARNRTIVDRCDLLIAAPPIDEWAKLERGGTIYTIRYARKTGRRVAICIPYGTVEYA